ncbi:MAG: hypothetical protein NDJ89_18225 [Oligoflexia bacterium]|nr:hypothetical protein [Oligoflexia bacterium]
MSRRKTNRLWLIPVFALNLVPLAAWGEAPAGKARDLTASEVNQVVNDFKFVKEKSDPDSVLSLRGTFFEDCGLKIKVAKDASKRVIGYRFIDTTGRAAQCQQEHLDRDDDCDSHKCVVLSEQASLKIDLSAEGDLDFKLLRIDSRKDPKEQWDDLEATELNTGKKSKHHKGAGTFQAERLKAEENAKADRIARLHEQVRKCRGNLEALDVATNALAELEDVISSEEYEKYAQDLERIRKKRDNENFNKLLTRFSKLKTDEQGEMLDLIEQLSAYAEDPRKAKQIAEVYAGMAKKMMSAPKASSENFEDAAWMISEAQQLSGLSEGDQTTLRNYQRDIRANRFLKLAKSPSTDPSFSSEYMEYMQEMQTEVQDLCSGYDSSTFSECSSAMRTYQSVQQVPQIFNQAQYQQYMFQMQLQQQMAASFQMGGPGGFVNNPMGMMGGMSSPMYPPNPMMMGPMASPMYPSRF